MMMMKMIENDDGVWLLGVTPHTQKKEFFFLLFFCVFFLIFKFSTKKGFIQSKANGLGFDPQWRYCSKYPDDV